MPPPPRCRRPLSPKAHATPQPQATDAHISSTMASPPPAQRAAREAPPPGPAAAAAAAAAGPRAPRPLFRHDARGFRLEALPGPAQAAIAACLPDGGKSKNRRRVALVSKTLQRFHQGTLEVLSVQWKPTYRVEALASLLLLQRGLKRVNVWIADALPAVTEVLAQGRLATVEELWLNMDLRGSTTMAQVRALADAMQVPGALQALQSLRFLTTTPWPDDGLITIVATRDDDSPFLQTISWSRGMVPLLAGALASDAAPALRILALDSGSFQDEDLEALAAMLESRAARPACRGLDRIEASRLLCQSLAVGARCRVLQALLLTVTSLDEFRYDDAYDACFVESPPPRLMSLVVGGVAVPPAAVLRALPALEDLRYHHRGSGAWVNAHIVPVMASMRSAAALPQLHTLALHKIYLLPAQWTTFLDALVHVPTLSTLELPESSILSASVATFAGMVAQDRFPMLASLSLSSSPGIGEEGVVSLAEGLQAAQHTRLVDLNLRSVRMGDAGLTALARVVGTGRFDRLETLSLEWDVAVTDAGVCALAEAVEAHGARGLPMFAELAAKGLKPVTSVGVRALASALATHCPQMTWLDLSGREDPANTDKAMVLELVRGAGARYRLDFRV